MKISRKQLESLSKDDLYAIAVEAQKIKEAAKQRTLESYFETAHQDQIDFHKAAGTHRIRYFSGGNRCLVKGSIVDTRDGPVKIEDIKNGTYVYSFDHEHLEIVEARTTGSFSKGIMGCFEVEYDEGTILCSYDHQVLVKNGSFSSIKNIKVGDELLFGGFIKSIKEIGNHECFDITVPFYHNYFSNNSLNHNSGKSTAGFADDIMLALGRHPYKKMKIPNKGVVVVQDFENAAKNVLEVKFQEWTPEGEIERVEKNQAHAWRKIFFKNGSTIDVLSHDQDIKVFEGSDYDWAHFDEPPPKHIFTAIWRGLTDRGGCMHMTATPLASPWLYREYKLALDGDRLRWFRFVDTTKNAKNIGEGNEELGKKRIEEFASMLDEDEKNSRLHGMMVQMQGLIFKEWKNDHHLISEFEIPPDWHIWESIDPHPHKPWAITWVAVAESGHKILLRCLRAEGTIDQIAEQILHERTMIKIRGGSRPRIVRCIIDNSSSVPLWQKSNTDPSIERISVREELENYIGPLAGGAIIEVAPKNVSQKIDLFKRWLTIEQIEGGSSLSTFYVFNISENDRFVFEIENYVWDSSRNKGLKNTPKKVDDDCLDAVMQIALSMPRDYVGEERVVKRVWGSNRSWTAR